jgi:hypothetical protein
MEEWKNVVSDEIWATKSSLQVRISSREVKGKFLSTALLSTLM